MSIIKPHIARIAREFWSKAGKRRLPTFDIVGAVSLILPVDIVSLSELSLKKVEQWLSERKVVLNIDMNDRHLHGFILTFKGSGFIFINGTDSEEERRFTVAHEASHFILDYKLPRVKAIEKFGPKIIEVLDGDRNPTNEERIDGLLSSVSVQPYTHLLEKVGDGSFDSIKIFDSENDADALAVELLAPSANVIKDTKIGNPKISFDDFRTHSLQILREKYMLPEAVAKDYSLRLSYVATGGPSLLSKLGF